MGDHHGKISISRGRFCLSVTRPLHTGDVTPHTALPTPRGLASVIDHTLLADDATEAQIRTAIAEAQEFGCASICLRPEWVKLASSLLDTTTTGITTVVAFPDGDTSLGSKVRESALAVSDGATEIDLVINYPLLQQGLYEPVRREIQGVRAATPGLTLKIILETATLTDAQITLGCAISSDAGADFVKTSTGYHPAGGATLHAVEIMAREVPHMGVKASGGIRTRAQAEAFLKAGATRLGVSATRQILNDSVESEANSENTY